ncbi:MAG: phosphate-starvation-inducible PsiE family protein [Microcoleaceae cyanobacterium]
MKKSFKRLNILTKDENFVLALEQVQVIVSKILSLAMVALILATTAHLILFLGKELLFDPSLLFKGKLFEVFGLFLNLLIALEILENISSYLTNHVIQVELVIVTSLIAVSRKIIILDLEKTTGLDIIGLALAILSLSISYWIIRRASSHHE